LTEDYLQKMAHLFNVTTDQILYNDGKIPKEVVIEDKPLHGFGLSLFLFLLISLTRYKHALAGLNHQPMC